MDSEHTTTNIRLPRKTLEFLKLRAVKERKSLAQLIREALDEVYGTGAGGARRDVRRSRLYKLEGLGASGIRDGSEHHDRDIYGVDTDKSP